MITVRDRSEDAKTFTDDTSPKPPIKTDNRVSINGQVIREESFEWFRTLRKLYPDEQELKSKSVLESFHALPLDVRARIWKGMRRVRINVVDSLPYQVEHKESFYSVCKDKRLLQMIEADARHQEPVAKLIKKMMDEHITESIVRDSTPYRLREQMRPVYPRFSLSFYIQRDEPYELPPVDLKPFRKKNASMVGTAVKYAAQAAPVFNDAIDEVTALNMFLHEHYTRMRVHMALSDSHAFDEGDDKSLEWVKSQRANYHPYGGCYPFEYVDDFGGVFSMPSDESPFLQAADVAAAFARVEYERTGIAGVASQFDYVTINGERIKQDNAEERFEFWRKLSERQANLERARQN